jgi:hypothetical protein
MAKEPIEIRELIKWALVDQMVEAAIKAANARMVHSGGGMVTSAVALQQMLKLGCKIDGHGPGDAYNDEILIDCHVDAVKVYDALVSLPHDQAKNSVYFHSIKCTTPDWAAEGVGKLVPVLGKNGKPKPLLKSARPDGEEVRTIDGVKYLMEYDGLAPYEVKLARAQYSVWYNALVAIQLELEKKLQSFSPQPPSVCAQPWERMIKKVG